MKRKNFYILSLVFCLATASALAGLTTMTGAQGVSSKPPTTPLKTATPPTLTTATPEPKPEDEEGELKIDTEVVQMSIRVVDRNSRPINNLSQNDFKIYEDNVLQPIDYFTKAEVPTNYSLVIDNSGSLRLQLEKVIEASKIIVGTNRADDETSIIRFVSSDKINIEQDFTSNKDDLFYALDQLFVEGGQTAIIDAVYLATQRINEYEKATGGRDDKKRRALILVSDGEDRDSFYNEQQLFELLRESDVQIYTIGFVGELSKEGGFISKSPQSKAKSFLERLAQETGGKSYFPNALGELNGIASDIASELRTQYLVSYYPTNTKKDGSYRTIKVVVNDGPNKQKRIAISRNGRKADIDGPVSNQPVTPTPQPVKKP